MNKFHILTLSILSILCWGCSDDDNNKQIDRTDYAEFVSQKLNATYHSGETVALVEWSAVSWEISMVEDKGIISHISLTKGGGDGSERQYAQIKLSYTENPTGDSRMQQLLLKNLKTGEISTLDFVQDTRYSKLTVAVDPTTRYQHVVGFGGMYNPVIWTGNNLITNAEIEKMYHPDQLGYTILRLMVYDKESDWAADVAGAKAAQQQGAILFASPWYCPEGTTEKITVNGREYNHLKTGSYPDFAAHLVKYINYMKNNGVNIYAISVQNEPDMEFTYWYPQEVVNFIKAHGDEIRATGVKLMAPEACGMQPEYTDPVLNDPEAFAKVDIVAGHLYQGFTETQESDYIKARHDYISGLYNSKLSTAGKTWWMTEHLFNDGEKETDPALWEFRNWSYNLEHLAKEIHMSMEGYCSAYIYWYLKRFYGMLGDDDPRSPAPQGEVMKNGYILSHYAKYASDMERIRIDTGNSNLQATAYINKEGTQMTIVFLNRMNDSYFTHVTAVGNVSSATAVVTTEDKNMQSIAVTIGDDKQSISLPIVPKSIVSIKINIGN